MKSWDEFMPRKQGSYVGVNKAGYEEIQLDAFKAGAEWAAAQEVEVYPNDITVSCLRNLLESIYDDGARDLSKKILKELEKLTEIPK